MSYVESFGQSSKLMANSSHEKFTRQRLGRFRQSAEKKRNQASGFEKNVDGKSRRLVARIFRQNRDMC